MYLIHYYILEKFTAILLLSYKYRHTSGSTVDIPGTLNALGTMSGCNSPGGITRARTPTATISGTDRSSGSTLVGGVSGGLRQSGSSSALSSLSSSNVDIGRTFEQGMTPRYLRYFITLTY